MLGLRLNIPAPVIVHKDGAGIAPAALPLRFIPYHELADTALVDTVHGWLVIDRPLPAFPNTVQFAMWDVFTVRKPFRFRAALPYLEHFAGGRTFFLTDRRFRSSAFNSAGR